mmetsp:Transcript_31153/g.63779  ORF Transcript_31153/g.63779 Transcript_31153/m.63779 type:complete len:223 (-) Transcript_31153:190-858(-)
MHTFEPPNHSPADSFLSCPCLPRSLSWEGWICSSDLVSFEKGKWKYVRQRLPIIRDTVRTNEALPWRTHELPRPTAYEKQESCQLHKNELARGHTHKCGYPTLPCQRDCCFKEDPDFSNPLGVTFAEPPHWWAVYCRLEPWQYDPYQHLRTTKQQAPRRVGVVTARLALLKDIFESKNTILITCGSAPPPFLALPLQSALLSRIQKQRHSAFIKDFGRVSLA